MHAFFALVKRHYFSRNHKNRADVRRLKIFKSAGFFWLAALLLQPGSIDAQQAAANAATPSIWSCAQQQQANTRAVSWKRLTPNFLCDQKNIWLFPTKVARGKHLVPVLAVVGVTTGLIWLDHSDAPYFRRTTSFNSFNNAFSGNNTALATALAPAALYAAGLIAKDSYLQNTVLLAGEAVLDAEVVSFVAKDLTQRIRPRDIAPNGNFGDTFYRASSLSGSTSFPSGHEIAAFSIATVVARRYGGHKWVPYVAYGGAALIGFSRITTSGHFPADVFAGAALGYCIGRFAVLH